MEIYINRTIRRKVFLMKCCNCGIQIPEGTGQAIFISDNSIIFCPECYEEYQEDMKVLPKTNSL